MNTHDVIFSERAVQEGCVIAQAHLNIPATLNALTLAAVEAMTSQMLSWATRDEVVAVIVTGEGAGPSAQAAMCKRFIKPLKRIWPRAVW